MATESGLETNVERGRRSRMVAPRGAEHVVFLIPGLLGFECFSTFGYFADRVIATLRANLEQRLHEPVVVLAVPIPPTAALADRQRELVKTISGRLEALEEGAHELQVHLIGHSTGGVDAVLLTSETAIGGAAGGTVDSRAPQWLRRVRSVTSLASPHQGACIAHDPAIGLLRREGVAGLPTLLKLLWSFASSSLGDLEIRTFVESIERESAKARRFFSDVLSHWPLLGDLQPQVATRDAKLRTDVPRRSFVTLAGEAKKGAAIEPPDAFYRALAACATGTNTHSTNEGAYLAESVKRLERALGASVAQRYLIRNPNVIVPAGFGAASNDGIVNTARQLVDPSDEHELAGVVVGDHFDVLGYYDREVWRTDKEGRERSAFVLAGLLHSGSGFRDDQFFELYRRMAAVIADTIAPRSKRVAQA